MATTSFKLLYVCNGNNARSPIAAASTLEQVTAYNEILWDVDSAGTHAITGDPMRDEALTAATTLGIDLDGHRALELASDACHDPDLILAMSWEQVSHIWSLVPEAWDKVFTIKEFVHWATRSPARPPILFPDKISEMRDKIIQAHAMRKRARADYGFWGGIRPQDLNLIEPNGKGDEAWLALANAVKALTTDVIKLLRGPEVKEPAPKRARVGASRAKARR